MKIILTRAQAREALSIRDLTDPSEGAHALQALVDDVAASLSSRWGCMPQIHRCHPVVSVEDNYDRLRYPSDGPARDARYTRYVSEVQLLRSQTSAMVPALLRHVARVPSEHVLLVCPGIVYRRDVIDRLHTGEPHQLDLWRLKRGSLNRAALPAMIDAVVACLAPGRTHRVVEAVHPYTLSGLQIDVRNGDEWIEIGECGLAHPEVLAAEGLDPRTWSGLAMGLGLDRLLMLRKGIDDIRLLRSDDARVARQMQDLEPYRPVSNQPAVRRDLSIAISRGISDEEIGDRVREALGPAAAAVEHVQVTKAWHYEDLPEPARTRLGMSPGHKNALVRVVLRDLTRTLSAAEANTLRNRIYAALHEGANHEWA